MPKRAQTPPPADDTRFFTVVNPYPEQPYVALEDSKTFARWIACMIGQEHLLAFHHKPKSPNVVIIEASKVGPDFSRLMGEHRWSMVLKNPEEYERQEASYIFPCALTTTRAIEKTGWVCRDIPSSWFRRWSPDSDSLITSPYPQPRRCAPPSEDVTRYPLCRPIPQSSKETPSNSSRRTAPHSDLFVSSDDDLPTLPSSSASDFSDASTAPQPFIPAIHGCDAPKANRIVASPATVATTRRCAPLDTGDDDEDDNVEEAKSGSLCSAHGALCVSGICKECAARKREARFAQRALQREAERAPRGCGRDQGERVWKGVLRSRGIPNKPNHLQQQVRLAGTASTSTSSVAASQKKEADPRSRVRDDIRAEIATRRQGARSVTSGSARAMPSHLLKGSSQPMKTRTSSSTARSRPPAFDAPTLHSYDSLSESGSESPRAPSVSDSSECAQSTSSRTSATSASNIGSSICGQDDNIGSFVASVGRNTSRNPWKQPLPMRPAPFKWADTIVEKIPGVGVRSSWDDDSSEEEEVF
ncbi:hypothetical protein BC628DRAFT_154328 [Trametes gibbosa]|nr:hypothetical protein BC628DRAFT_154328 [Trametes gibbosa]